jgi:hypothetical protein
LIYTKPIRFGVVRLWHHAHRISQTDAGPSTTQDYGNVRHCNKMDTRSRDNHYEPWEKA